MCSACVTAHLRATPTFCHPNWPGYWTRHHQPGESSKDLWRCDVLPSHLLLQSGLITNTQLRGIWNLIWTLISPLVLLGGLMISIGEYDKDNQFSSFCSLPPMHARTCMCLCVCFWPSVSARVQGSCFMLEGRELRRRTLAAGISPTWISFEVPPPQREIWLEMPRLCWFNWIRFQLVVSFGFSPRLLLPNYRNTQHTATL